MSGLVVLLASGSYVSFCAIRSHLQIFFYISLDCFPA